MEIENPEDAYEYTSKGNLVAVVNGTAILGLGDAAHWRANRDGRQGSAVQKFADIDVFDIELNSHDPDEIIKIVAAISPRLGDQSRRHQSP